MKKCALCGCLAFCLLAGCGSKGAESTPLPTPAPMPTEIPDKVAEDLAGALRAAVGEDFYAEAGQWRLADLSQCPGFEVYTGFSALETPPEQVSFYRRAYLGGRCFEVFVNGGNNEAPVTVLITGLQEGGQAQKIPLSVRWYMHGDWGFQEEDCNFDGLPDISLNLGGAEHGGARFRAALLWDPETETYHEEPEFSKIESATVDEDHEVYWGGSDYNFGYFYNAYEYVDGALMRTHGIETQPIYEADWDAGTSCMEWALADGEWVHVRYREFVDDAGEYPQILADYIAAEPAWEGWHWCDPWAFYRYG